MSSTKNTQVTQDSKKVNDVENTGSDTDSSNDEPPIAIARSGTQVVEANHSTFPVDENHSTLPVDVSPPIVGIKHLTAEDYAGTEED